MTDGTGGADDSNTETLGHNLEIWQRYASHTQERGLAPTESVILIDPASACQYHFYRGRLAGAYLCSTAAAGLGEEAGSHRTPRGLHVVEEKHGDGLPPGAILKARVPTGQNWRSVTPAGDPGGPNLVTTRLLWLRGLEPGFNAGPGRDSKERYIYIHGTNRESRLGHPVSGGCILMRDAEIAWLYPRIPVGSHVWISPECADRV